MDYSNWQRKSISNAGCAQTPVLTKEHDWELGSRLHRIGRRVYDGGEHVEVHAIFIGVQLMPIIRVGWLQTSLMY